MTTTPLTEDVEKSADDLDISNIRHLDDDEDIRKGLKISPDGFEPTVGVGGSSANVTVGRTLDLSPATDSRPATGLFRVPLRSADAGIAAGCEDSIIGAGPP